MNIDDFEFLPLHDDTYNANKQVGECVVSLSYGGIAYGSGFFNRGDGSIGGTFEVCVFKNDMVIQMEPGKEVLGWQSIEDVNHIISCVDRI